jgi:hypothetical protein
MGSSVDAKLTKIVMKALEKRPEDRYQSASDFQDDLRKWLDFRRDDFMADSAHHGRFRQDTPHHAKQTPMHGVPSPGLSEPSESSEAPPVQIFSRPRRRHQPTPHVSTISPAPERETPKESKPLALSDPSVVDPRDEKAHGSTAAKIITGVIIVLVLALVAWLSL